jgi:hypothetical protein
MGDTVLELGNEELKKIGEYVQTHLSEWIHGSNVIAFKTDREIELLERMIRVEEELKNQREIMKQGFDLMDKRFEDMYLYMDKRFEAVDKRFEDIFRYMDKRFEAVDKRFEAVDKRFEDVNSRFDDMSKKFTMMFIFMNLGLSILIAITVVFKFIG